MRLLASAVQRLSRSAQVLEKKTVSLEALGAPSSFPAPRPLRFSPAPNQPWLGFGRNSQRRASWSVVVSVSNLINRPPNGIWSLAKRLLEHLVTCHPFRLKLSGRGGFLQGS